MKKKKKNLPLKQLGFSYEIIEKEHSISKKLMAQEAVIVLLSWRCVFSCEGKTYVLGPRRDVFSGKSHSVYVPPRKVLKISSKTKRTEIAFITVPAGKKYPLGLVHIKPNMVKPKKVGQGTFRRSVQPIFTGNAVGSQSHLLVGETFNEPGKWSSFPPHRHAKDRSGHETKYEEVYFFKVKPDDGFGLIRVYDKKWDHPFTIKNNDTCVVTEGYHPVCAAPGCRLYYLWAMVGKKRSVVNVVDPTFIAWSNK